MSILDDLSVQNVTVPSFFYGTAWKEAQTMDCVRLAVGCGYRAIDTANQRKHYHEAGVGDALRFIYDLGELTREDFFLQTKFTYRAGQDHRLPYDPDASYTEQVQQSFASSLEHLHTDTLDSYVLHGPADWEAPGITDPDRECWRAMEELQRSGKVKLLGVSNVRLSQLEDLYTFAEVKPAFVQNRCFARLGWDREIRDFCRNQGILYQGFSLLTANRAELGKSRVSDLAASLDVSVAQLVFRFARQLGIIPLTGTTDVVHMALDRALETIRLNDNQLDMLENISVIL